MFSFDDKYMMFDITPVENQFVLEYLPQAKGDYVKVWLYGLTQCYYPRDGMSLERMANELNMEQEEVEAAFRYWERRGLVQRISDVPPQYRYINVKQHSMSGQQTVDTAYEAFAESLYAVFGKDRRLHGSEISQCFEWVEELKLPTEVVIMLLKHLADTKGKNFTITAAERVAVQMAEEGANTLEKAEEFLSRDRKAVVGARKILKLLGNPRQPSEIELRLYIKWTREWGFDHDAVEKACEQTAKGAPTFAYLDGILNRMHSAGSTTLQQIRQDERFNEDVRTFLHTLGRGSMSDETVQLYREMLEMYPKEVVLLASRACARKGSNPGQVKELLSSWKKKHLKTETEIRAYIAHFDEQTAILRELREKWGARGAISAADRAMLDKWQREWHLDKPLILKAAELSAGTEKPMAYADKILENCIQKGLLTPELMEKNREQSPVRRGKVLPAQNFDQRPYQDDLDDMDRLMRDGVRMKESGPAMKEDGDA